MYVRSIVAPREWASRRRLIEINEFFWSPNIAIDRSGEIHIAYADFQQGQVKLYYVKANAATGKVTTPVLVAEHPVSIIAPALAVDQEGNAHLAWLDGRDEHAEIYYAEIAGLSSSRAIEKRLSSDSTDCGEPQLAVDWEGNVHVVWHSKKGEVTVTPIDYEIFHCKLDKNGRVLVPEKMLFSSDGFYSIKPTIAIDGENLVHITWIDNRNTEIRDFHEVFYRKLDPEGRTISHESVIGRISRLVTVDHAPTPLVDKQGNIAFVFIDRSSGRLFEIYVKKIDKKNMIVFDRVRLATSRVFSKTGLPSTVLDNNDNICVVYADIRSDTAIEEFRKDWLFEAIYGKWRFTPLHLKLRWHIFYSKIDSSGQLVANDKPVERNHYSSSSPTLAVDSRNAIHIVYLEDDREQYRFVHMNDVSDNSFLSLGDMWDLSEKVLQSFALSLALVPFFTVSNALFLLSVALFSMSAWSLRRWMRSVNPVLHSPSVLLALCIVLKYAVLALGYDRLIQFYPGGLSQVVTGAIAVAFLSYGLKAMKAKIESASLYFVLTATWMILDTFYNLCMISAIAIDPIY